MIERIRIRNFRCLRDFEVKLGPLNFLVGANNTGKSSLLDALRVLSQCMIGPVETVLTPDAYSRVHCHWAPEEEPIEFSVAVERTRDLPPLSQRDIPYNKLADRGVRSNYALALQKMASGRLTPAKERVELRATNNDLLAILEPAARGAISVTEHMAAQDPSCVKMSHLQCGHSRGTTILQALRLNGYTFIDWLRTEIIATPKFGLFPRAIRTPSQIRSDATLREDGSGLATVLHALYSREPSRFHAIRKALCDLVPGVCDVIFPAIGDTPRFTIMFYESGGAKVYASEASDGLLLFLAILTIAYGHEEDVGIVLLEEPENGVHPQRLRDIVRLLRAMSRGELGLPPVQVVVTSHSPYLLDWCQKDEVIVFGRGPDGKVHAKRLDELPDIDERLENYESLGAYVYEIAEQACGSHS